jgi:hypothetical protein
MLENLKRSSLFVIMCKQHVKYFVSLVTTKIVAWCNKTSWYFITRMTSYINITVASFPTLTCVPIFDNNVLKHFYQKKFQRQGVGRGGGRQQQNWKICCQTIERKFIANKMFLFCFRKIFFFAKMSKFVAEKLIVLKKLIFSHST